MRKTPIFAKNRRFGASIWIALSLLLLSVSLGISCGGLKTASKPEVLLSLDEVVAKLPHFDVSGQAVNADTHKPLPDADVFLYYARGPEGMRDRLAGRTKTGADGAFRFEKALVWEPQTETQSDRFEPSYSVLIRHPEMGIGFVTIYEGDPLENLQVPAWGKREKTVTVVDMDGKPVPGALVRLCDGEYAKGVLDNLDAKHRRFRLNRNIGLSSGVTDENGKVNLMVVPAAQTVVVEKDGYAPGWYKGKITICPSARVSGRVTLEDGTPVAGAAVWFGYEGERLGSRDVALTDADGRYVFANVPGSGFRYGYMKPDQQKGVQGTGTLRVDDLRPGSPFVSKKIAFPINPGDRIEKDLVLEKGCVLGGKVVEISTGKPVAGMKMNRYIRVPGAQYLSTVQLTTDENGEFRTIVAPGSNVFIQWEESREGKYLIDTDWRQQDNYQPLRDRVVTEDITDLVLKVKLWPVQTLTGRVLDESGVGVPKVQIHFHGDAGRSNVTDDTGAFTLLVAPTDRDFDILAITADKKRAGLIRCKAGASQATIVLAPTQDYTGQVVNTDGLPAPGLKFYVDMKLNGRGDLWVRWEPKTDPEGKFKLKNLVPGAVYSVFWSSDNEDNRDYDYGNAEIDLNKLKPGEEIRFEAKRFVNALMGRVVNEKGEPIAGAKVEPEPGDLMPQNARFNQQPIVCGAQGEFTVSRLAPGEVQLRVSADGYMTRTVSAPTDSVDFEVALKQGSKENTTYAVRVIGEDGGVLAGVPVNLYMATPRKEGLTTEVLTVKSGPNGIAAFVKKSEEALPGGQCVVFCDLEGYYRAFLGLRPGDDVEADLPLEKASAGWRGRVTDTAGKPIAGAAIRVTGLQTGSGGGPNSHVMLRDWYESRFSTDSEGRFELTRFNPKKWTNVSITYPGCAKNDSYFDPRRSDPDGKEKTFTLEKGASLKGKVVGPDGNGLGKMHVFAHSSDRSSQAQAQTGPDGSFEMTGLKPGDCEVSSSPGRPEDRQWVCPERPTIELAAGETKEITLKMEIGILLKGKMVEAGTGKVPSGRKFLGAQRGELYAGGAEVKDDGLWEMYLPEGEFELRWSVVGGMARYPQGMKTIRVAKGAPLDNIVIEVAPPGK